MTLYHCKYCKENVSPRANTCPHCGEPEPAAKEEPLVNRSIRLIGVVLFLMSGCYLGLGINIIAIHPLLYLLVGMVGLTMMLNRDNTEEIQNG